MTHAPWPNSLAVNAGDNADAPPTDQRGLARIVGGTIDIGSYEVQKNGRGDDGGGTGGANSTSPAGGDAPVGALGGPPGDTSPINNPIRPAQGGETQRQGLVESLPSIALERIRTASKRPDDPDGPLLALGQLAWQA